MVVQGWANSVLKINHTVVQGCANAVRTHRQKISQLKRRLYDRGDMWKTITPSVG